MPNTYHGERIPGTIHYRIQVAEGTKLRSLVLSPSLQPPESITGTSFLIRDRLLYTMSHAVLTDYLDKQTIDERTWIGFTRQVESLFSEDFWILHSDRIASILQSLVEESGSVSNF
ncbi:hypothetical protein LPTSP4_06320 [Leptospira ryugenii]|uniref:Uncharacterized protein n=1 Tax=Leptospira ryugenii TaxID=1917863 RepID=A0A2P2DWY9_9LEPT|nr:hypothetical protein [Leptospira ryugenii]GBF49122.1 hypothetical protein LPTSP4_06320 [Leptospira ryugenii]